MIYKAGDIVEVPFPFIDSDMRKKRPALVLSEADFQQANGACVLTMITSAERSRWRDDLELEHWAAAGLAKPSIVRWKLFTLDESLLLSRRGILSDLDRQRVGAALRKMFPVWLA